jgi:DNA-binding response OmpR family regulator
MSRVRLDKILLRQGLVTDDQIKQALMRQRSRGGRLGSHLFFFRFLSEEQLVNALAEQLGVPGVKLNDMQIPDEVIGKVPVNLVDKFNVVPFAFVPETNSLSLAVIDPDNKEAPEQIKQASGAREVKVFVAVDSVLRNKIAQHYHGRMSDPASRQVIELPDLFEEDKSLADLEEVDQHVDDEKFPDPLNVLMVTKAAFLRNVLSSIFEREGYTLQIHSQPDEITRALGERSFDYVLVSQDMEEEFSRWIKEGTIPFPRAEISLFTTICGALLDNPAPYPMMIESLLRSLQKLSEYRQTNNNWKPSYELICNDIRNLGRALDLRRIAVDGLQIISNTLIPAENSSPVDQNQPDNPALNFETSNGSRSVLNCLHFPWDLEGCLNSFFDLLSGKLSLSSSDDRKREMMLGPQILAVVWYRHYTSDGIEGDRESIFEATNTLLRKQEGHLFSSEVLETYLRILEQNRNQGRIGIQNDIFIVSEPNEIAKQFSTHMRKAGFRIVTIDNLSEARSLYQRQRPDIMVVNYDNYPNHAMKFSRFVKKDSKTLMYAITNQSKSSLIMSLLDSGFSDVFTPPFKYDIIVARITKSIAILSELSAGSEQYRGFSGTFQELPLINLIQALAMSQRDVRITLDRGQEDSAEIFMRNGQMVYSKYGAIEGVDAIYKIIGWGDNGSFKIEHAQTFPPDNISLPNDFIIMEGCRQMDEERL